MFNNLNFIDKDLLKHLGKLDDYINEYKQLLVKQYDLLSKNDMCKNTKEFIKNFKRLSELVLIIEFIDIYNKTYTND